MSAAQRDHARLVRSRWAAFGAAVAVTLGAGGLVTVGAASNQSVFVPVSPQRVLDTRFDIGLTGAMTSGSNRTLDVTGNVAVVRAGNTPGTATIVPEGATAIVANVTAVRPTSTGFVTVRPGNVTGTPTTSNVNITGPGGSYPNAVTVELTASGTIGLYFFADQAGGVTHLLLDIVGYYVPSPGGGEGLTGTDSSGSGVSPWDTIPSGQTLAGPLNFDGHQAGDGSSDEFFIPFGAVAPAPLANTKVNFAPVGDGGGAFGDQDAACTGSADAPTAPVGKVCIYVAFAGGVDRDSTAGWAPFHLADRGFNIGIVPAGNPGDDMYLFGSWAYTAP